MALFVNVGALNGGALHVIAQVTYNSPNFYRISFHISRG
jgi:hypothetical protein